MNGQLVLAIVFITVTVFLSQSQAMPPVLDENTASKILEPICPCPKLYSPVCGSDDKTYANSCVLDCQKQVSPDLFLRRQGRCNSGQDIPYIQQRL